MGHKNQTDMRPLSPHLTIYKPQITSVLSITHRLTGLALFAGVLLLGWWIVLRVYGCGSCVTKLTNLPFVHPILILFSMAFYYHLLNGLRHLFWDAGKGYTIPVATRSGWAVIVGTVVLTVASWFLSYIL
jgi:succinate dehydrogenase / fumarate reductase cytochrome b subunit